jgi:hypothetical protein
VPGKLAFRGVVRIRTGGSVVIAFPTHIAADLDAGIGTGDVVVANPIKAADLHVFN